MNYFLNEYSIRGQYKDIDDFFEKFRCNTLPVFKKIEGDSGNVIWRKDTFWQLEICNKITLMNIPKKKNERSVELTMLKNFLSKLVKNEPFFDSCDKNSIRIKEYKFDEEYRDKFEFPNCFSKAIEDEGIIFSFFHPSYQCSELHIIITHDCEKECVLDNIYNLDYWINEPEIKTWKTENGCVIQVRAKEYEYHPPHFHVIHNEFEAVFHLKTGELYKPGKKWDSKMNTYILKWYQEHNQELMMAWTKLHGETKPWQ